MSIRRRRGRPAEGEKPAPSRQWTLLLPVPVSEELERRAASRDIPVHQAMREAVVVWLALADSEIMRICQEADEGPGVP
jgi:hypothetical protein